MEQVAYAICHLSDGTYSLAQGTPRNPLKRCIAVFKTLDEAVAHKRLLETPQAKAA